MLIVILIAGLGAGLGATHPVGTKKFFKKVGCTVTFSCKEPAKKK